MIQMSNSDFRKVRKILVSYSFRQGDSLREQEAIRQARLLLKKWDRRERPDGP